MTMKTPTEVLAAADLVNHTVAAEDGYTSVVVHSNAEAVQRALDALNTAGYDIVPRLHLTGDEMPNPQWEMIAPGSFTLPDGCNYCLHAAHNGLCLALADPPGKGQARCACTGRT
jgi:hypothetical protein